MVDISDRTSLEKAFYYKENLTKLEVNIDSSKVTNVGYMFYGCTNLTSLNLGEKFDTSKVTSMYSMFYGCSNLTSLDLGEKFDTSKVTDMSWMFGTSQVTDMGWMFFYCSNLTSLDLGEKFDTSKVTDMSYMFNGCSNLETVTGTISGISVDLDLRYSPLSKESAMVFINGLNEGVSGKILALKKSTYDSLSEEQRAIATNKGWTVNY